MVVGLGGEVETAAFPGGGLLAHGVQQRVGDSASAVVGMDYDVFNVDIVGIILAAEGDHHADEFVVFDCDGAG